MLQPKLCSTLAGYTRKQFVADLISGVIVGIVALPLCIAFAIASGLPPEMGLVTGVIAGFLISALGGSRVQIGGPAGAFVVIIFSIVQEYGLSGLALSTMMAGVILIIMGIAGLGAIIKFIPQPVIVGFTTGIAIIIMTTQVPDFFGLTMGEVPSDFFAKWGAVAEHFGSVNPWSVVIASGTVLVLVFSPRITRRIPGSFIALILATVLAQVFHLPVETIGSRFGEIQASLPCPVMPEWSFATVKTLVEPATTIALLVAIESLLSAVVADGMISGHHRSNMELVAQGVANIFSPLFGGMPATGTIARTATNVKNGGRTPVAGIVHSITLLLILILFGKWASLVPLSALAAILVVVAWHMAGWRSVRAMLHRPKSDVLVLLTTFGLTVVVNLTVAIQVGIVLAAFLFMKRMVSVTTVKRFTEQFSEDPEDIESYSTRLAIQEGFDVYEINGPLFFGAVYKFREAIRGLDAPPQVRILRMRQVSAIDSTGLQALEDLLSSSTKRGTALLISGIHAQPFSAMIKDGLLERFGEENVLSTFDEALERAREIVGKKDE